MRQVNKSLLCDPGNKTLKCVTRLEFKRLLAMLHFVNYFVINGCGNYHPLNTARPDMLGNWINLSDTSCCFLELEDSMLSHPEAFTTACAWFRVSFIVFFSTSISRGLVM